MNGSTKQYFIVVKLLKHNSLIVAESCPKMTKEINYCSLYLSEKYPTFSNLYKIYITQNFKFCPHPSLDVTDF